MVQNLHEHNQCVEAEYLERMKELQGDVERRETEVRRLAVEEKQQELAHHQQLAAVEAKQKEYLEYFDLAAEAHQ